MSATSPDFWAFLSYSSHDRATAIWIQRALETYTVPRRFVGRQTPFGPAPRKLRPIFRDRTELAADPDLAARIADALAKSAYLIVVCSPSAAKSRWVNEEITRFRDLHGASRILSVIVEGPQDDHESCFPPALHYRSNSAGAAARAEPLAADLRPGGDGRRLVRLKLLAGMLGVGLDELVRRDTQRRHRQLFATTAASLIGLALTAALATAALIGRNEARRQRAQAEGLIEFMLTDLRKKLEPSGRLDAMDGVGREALKYYGAQRPADLDAQSLARRSRALRLMGEITVQRGDLGDALKNFEQASATTAELMARSPRDAQTIFNHAQSIFWVGDIARQRGELNKAEEAFVNYRSLAGKLTQIDAHNDDWWAEVAYAESALGVLFLQEARASEARGAFERSLTVFEAMAKRKPDDINLQIELGQGHAWLAETLQKQGQLAETRAHTETELAIYRAVLARDPTIRQAKFSTVDALLSSGRLSMLEGDLKGAIAAFSGAAERGENLLDVERDNMDLASVVASAHVSLGESLLMARSIHSADTEQQRAVKLLKTALAHDDTVALWRGYRDRADLLEAAIAAARGEQDLALQLDQALLSRLNETASQRPNTEPFLLLQRSRLQTGDDLAALGRSQDAKAQWTEVARSLSGPLENYEPRQLELLAAAQTRLGRKAEAQAVTKRLQGLFQPAALL